MSIKEINNAWLSQNLWENFKKSLFHETAKTLISNLIRTLTTRKTIGNLPHKHRGKNSKQNIKTDFGNIEEGKYIINKLLLFYKCKDGLIFKIKSIKVTTFNRLK